LHKIYNRFFFFFFFFPEKYPNAFPEFLLAYIDINLNRNFIACPDESFLPKDLWAYNSPDNIGATKACVKASFQEFQSGFKDVSCFTSLKAMCQVIFIHIILYSSIEKDRLQN
jgi:hypothetical protein